MIRRFAPVSRKEKTLFRTDKMHRKEHCPLRIDASEQVVSEKVFTLYHLCVSSKSLHSSETGPVPRSTFTSLD